MRTIDYVGWVVLVSDPRQPYDRRFARCRNQGEARELARRLNSESVREYGTKGPLYWHEYITRDSVVS